MGNKNNRSMECYKCVIFLCQRWFENSPWKVGLWELLVSLHVGCVIPTNACCQFNFKIWWA